MAAPLTPVDGWPAPAKINLFLHVTDRRADGYHELQTVFQFLAYGDTLHFTVREDGIIERRSELAGVAPEHDLVVRAARRLQEASGTPLGVTIAVDKRIPMGAGLGGGSSNAATTLVALNRLWHLRFTPTDLAAIGLRLGADVPIFIHGRAAWAEGVGEHLTDIDLPEPWYLVVHPGCHIPTVEIFTAPELTRNTQPIKISDFLASQTHNDCEPVARRRYPEVGAVLEWFATQGSNARMTGTGACVFASCSSLGEAQRLLAALPERWTGFVSRGLNRSPLLECLKSLE